MSSPSDSAFDHYEAPLLSREQVCELINALPQSINSGLHERLNAVLCAQAPGPYSDALGELEAYLAGLEDAGSLSFDHLIQLKAYVMVGWKAWRAGFVALKV